MRTLGDMIAVDLLMSFRNSTQHQQQATQSKADIQKNNDQRHQEQGVLQSESKEKSQKNQLGAKYK